MILSMTGYGRSSQHLHNRDICVEVKSVNSRYFEYSSRLARGCGFMDDRLKKMLSAKIARGKAELTLTIQSTEADDIKIILNSELAHSYYDAMLTMAKELDIKNDISITELARFPDVFVVTKPTQDEDELWCDVQSVAEAAINNFVAMRAEEGGKLREDILARLSYIDSATKNIEKCSAGRSSAYIDKLTARLNEILADKNIDDTRIVQEAAIFADKTAVDEETVRLHSHISQFTSILEQNEPVGRKLDFLTQEINRETNTIGSKIQELELTRIVVDIKSEIEKIREQIQNIE